MTARIQASNVDSTDMSQYRSEASLKRFKNIYKVFQKVSGNKKKLELDQKQLVKLFKTIGHDALSSQDVRGVFEEIDVDRSGRIDFLELIRHLYGVKEILQQVMRREPLAQPELHVRISGDGSKGLEHLQTWTQESVTMCHNGQGKEFKVKSVVKAFQANSDDLEVWVSSLADNCTYQFSNAMLLVTGASGTDRMNTILGQPMSYDQHQRDGTAEFGILPHVVKTWLEYTRVRNAVESEMAENGNGESRYKFALGVSLLEFRHGTCYDLLCDNLPTVLDSNGMPQSIVTGVTQVSDLLLLINQLEHRKADVGKVKADSYHYAWHVCLYEVGLDTFGDFTFPGGVVAKKCSFLLIDVSTSTIVKEELSLVEAELASASEAHAKGKKYKPPAKGGDFVRCIQGCMLSGHAKSGLVACLSQDKDSDRYNWPAFAFAESMSQLKVQPVKHRNQEYSKIVEDAKVSHAAQAKVLTNTNKAHSSWPSQTSLTKALGQDLEIWRCLKLV